MTDVEAKFATLIRGLRAATEAGKITWEETADEAEFRAVLGPGMVRIGRHQLDSEDGEGMVAHTLTLLNRDGRIAEEFTARDDATVEDAEALYDLARSSARKGSDLIDGFLADLKGRLIKLH